MCESTAPNGFHLYSTHVVRHLSSRKMESFLVRDSRPRTEPLMLWLALSFTRYEGKPHMSGMIGMEY